MKVLVCGGRDYGDLAALKGNREHPDWARREAEYNHVMRVLNTLSLDWPKTEEDDYGNWLPNVTIISGMARGVDSCAADWAVVNWCDLKEYPADWDQYGKSAGYKRNVQMLEEKPDLVVAFPGGKGTAMMVRLAKDAGIPVKEVMPNTTVPGN